MVAALIDKRHRYATRDTFLYRLVLYPNEVFRLPRACTRISILDGRAWVTIGKQDRILIAGETMQIKGTSSDILVSALPHESLTFEIWTNGK